MCLFGQMVTSEGMRTMMRDRVPDIEVRIRLLSTEEGGRSRPVYTGYRPHFQIHETLQTSGEHVFLDKDVVHPGDEAIANILFIAPEHHPKSIWLGKEIDVKEGSMLIGRATVTKIYNKSLLID